MMSSAVTLRAINVTLRAINVTLRANDVISIYRACHIYVQMMSSICTPFLTTGPVCYLYLKQVPFVQLWELGADLFFICMYFFRRFRNLAQNGTYIAGLSVERGQTKHRIIFTP